MALKRTGGDLIFIPGQVPSSKNSKVKTAKGVFNSRYVNKYLRGLGIKKYSSKAGITGYKRRPNLFEQTGARYLFNGHFCFLGMHFVRENKRRFDFNNMTAIICDLLVAHKMIVDDDVTHMAPVPLVLGGRIWSIDKECPGVWLKVMDENDFAELGRVVCQRIK